MPRKRIVNPSAQIAASGPVRWSGRISEEFLPELRWPIAGRIYDEMRKNSAIVGGFIRAIEAAFRSTRWESVPYDDTPEAAERAAFLDSCIHDMARSWNDELTDILTFLPFGFAPTEMVFKYRKGPYGESASRYTDGKVGFKDLVLIPQSSIMEWIYDIEGDPNELIGIKQQVVSQTPPYTLREIPIEKVCLFRVKAEKNNPEGESVLRQAYRSYYFMTNLEAVEAISLERTGAGIPVVSLPEGASTEADAPGKSDEMTAQNVVRSVRLDEQGGIVEPFGWGFRIETSKGLRPELFDLAIKRHRANMLISVLAAFLELGTARVGSFGMAKAGQSFFSYAFEGWVMAVEETFNSNAVPLLFELNGINDGRLPRLGHVGTGGEAVADVITSLVELVKVGILSPQDENIRGYVAGMLRLPKGNTVVEQGDASGETVDEPEEELDELEEEQGEIPSVNGYGTNGASGTAVSAATGY